MLTNAVTNVIITLIFWRPIIFLTHFLLHIYLKPIALDRRELSTTCPMTVKAQFTFVLKTTESKASLALLKERFLSEVKV